MNPIEIFYSWQALVVALIVYAVTQLLKVVITRYFGAWFERTPNRVWWLKRIILPGIPPILGFLCAASVPIRPDAIIEYVSTHEISAAWASCVYGLWGSAVGQFADYVYSKVSAAVKDREISA